MQLAYYPGCTLHDQARGFDLSGRASAAALGLELEELAGWTCCGSTFPLMGRRIVGLVAPARTLVETRRAGRDKLLTLCTFCYNVLKRTNHTIRHDDEARTRLNAYLDDEYRRAGAEGYEAYGGEVEVVHLLEVLRDTVGFEALAKRVKRPLAGLRVAPYYGCLLLRPHAELQLDDPEHPTILDDLLRAIGCEVVDFPHKVECCGAHLGLSSPEVAQDSSHEILQMAHRLEVDALALGCPLCAFNLDRRQEAIREKHVSLGPLPVLYFTQLLALALELGEERCLFDRHAVDPTPLLRARRAL